LLSSMFKLFHFLLVSKPKPSEHEGKGNDSLGMIVEEGWVTDLATFA